MRAAAIAALAVLMVQGAQAGSLHVSPILLDVVDGKTSTLTLRNGEDTPLNAQIRVMRWSQTSGVEKLEPTTDVVASPPMTTLTGNVDQVIRIVRVSAQPMTAEESYRVLVDEIPSPRQRAPNTVSFVLRYSIPVFFSPRERREPAVAWSMKRSGDVLTLSAHNTGGTRLRLANLKLMNADGKLAVQRDGLVGYVLPGGTMRWPLELTDTGISTRTPIKLVADGETRPVHATIPVQASQ